VFFQGCTQAEGHSNTFQMKGHSVDDLMDEHLNRTRHADQVMPASMTNSFESIHLTATDR
jgi:hypothetical protein